MYSTSTLCMVPITAYLRYSTQHFLLTIDYEVLTSLSLHLKTRELIEIVEYRIGIKLIK